MVLETPNNQNKTMEASKIDLFMMMNAKYFESHNLPPIREKLMTLDEKKWEAIQNLHFRNPSHTLIISLLGGSLGIDRFYLGDTGLGIAKLLTCGGLHIWTIVDWFLIMGVAREKNMDMLLQEIY